MSKETKAKHLKSRKKELAFERELIKKSQKGDEKAFDELINLKRVALQNYCYKICGGHEIDGREVFQSSIIKAWNKIDKFQMNSSFATWFYKIAYNLNCDIHRALKRHKTLSLNHSIFDQSDDRYDVNKIDLEFYPETNSYRFSGMDIEENNNYKVPSVMRPYADLERSEQIQFAKEVSRKILRRLSKDHREVLKLREIKGLPYAKIAEKLKVSVGTVMSRLFYARKNALRIYKTVENKCK